MRENCQDAALTEAQEAAKNSKKEKIIIIVIVFNIVFLVLINSIPLVIYDWFARRFSNAASQASIVFWVPSFEKVLPKESFSSS